jgi:FdhD protein
MRDRSMTPVPIRRYVDGVPSEVRDMVASEEPMEIRVVTPDATHSVAVTMRTPGHEFELALGFMLAEGLISGRQDVLDVSYCPDPDEIQQFNIVNVTLAPTAAFDPTMLQRNFYATSSCGVCGKASLEAHFRCRDGRHITEDHASNNPATPREVARYPGGVPADRGAPRQRPLHARR